MQSCLTENVKNNLFEWISMYDTNILNMDFCDRIRLSLVWISLSKCKYFEYEFPCFHATILEIKFKALSVELTSEWIWMVNEQQILFESEWSSDVLNILKYLTNYIRAWPSKRLKSIWRSIICSEGSFETKSQTC